ncbi:MAG: hypothetical protein HY854_19785 [Burkholderiales bacterium]|nr:hypothetical protein [Burkholderiales bacterium]
MGWLHAHDHAGLTHTNRSPRNPGWFIQVSALPVVARALLVSLEELLGEGTPAARSKRGPTPMWAQQIEAIAKLPRARQRFVSEMLDTVLAQH